MRGTQLLETLVEAWQAHDALRAAACFSDGAVYQESDGREVRGRERIAAHFARFFHDGPPWRFDVDETIVQGDRAAVVYRFATKGHGKQWSERAGCAVVRFSGGLVTSWREYHG